MVAKRFFLTAALGTVLSTVLVAPVWAGETTIAVAANFTATAKDIAKAFEMETGHKAILAFGSTGKLYAQIVHGAPFDAFLAADQARPAKAEAEGFALKGSRFTYATGKIVLYSADASLVDDGGAVLANPGAISRLAIANPKTAPYGAAAVQVLERLGLYDGLKPKIVQGDSIAQAYQFVVTGNATLGFVAAAQVATSKTGSKWVVPEDLYIPIRQDAQLLAKGAGSDAAKAFLAFLKTPQARSIIRAYGYGVED